MLEFAEKGALTDFMMMPEFSPQTGHIIVQDIAQCLKYLHHDLPHPVMHRDIKPDNVLVAATIRGKVGSV